MTDSPTVPPVAGVNPAVPVIVAADDRPAMISLQERLVERALEAGASDLHIEPFPGRIRLRIRVDGWLRELDPLPGWMHAGLVSRFKVMAAMDVTERRRPQDGRATFESASTGVTDMRIATAATQYGEKLAIRLLPRRQRPLDIDELGLDSQRLRRVRHIVAQPYGLVLAAGPTGAGKTTTLHALLRSIDAIGRNVITLEDPIEYTLQGAVQIPVRHSLGFGFAAALRAVLRQDPDVILLGEIRDEETATIAVRAATTGHLVLSSVHTNSAAESVLRLFELGIPAYLVAAALIGVVSQRLVRRLCRRCRKPGAAGHETFVRLGLPRPTSHDRYFTNVGCSACNDGYAGRSGVFETLTLDATLRRHLLDPDALLSFEQEAEEAGALLPLRTSALAALRAGDTTVEEIERILPAQFPGFTDKEPDAGRDRGPSLLLR